MTKYPGNARRHKLADMTITPPPEPHYVPPGLDVAIQTVTPIDITREDQMVVRQRFYRGKVADFAICQKVRVNGKWVDVARIDCCHSTIHRHQFNQEGIDLYDHRVIIEIPAVEGWNVVDAGYDNAYNVMLNEWDQNLERWRNGG